MDEILRQTLIALRGMWRYRRVGLSVAWLAGACGIAVIAAIPSKYEARARIFVNTESILKPLMAGMTVAPDFNQRIQILTRVLVSRPNVERLVRMSGLDAGGKSKEEVDKRVDDLMRDLHISGTGRDQIYTVTLRDPEPEEAKRLVTQFTAMFIESGQGNRETETGIARKFIDQQIAVYEKKLEEAEEKLKDFKRRYLGMSPGEGRDYFARMNDASNLLNKAQLELREAEQSRDALRRGLEDATADERGAWTGTDPTVEVDARIESLKRDLALLLQKYTEAHPDVIGMRRVISDLEAQKASRGAARRKGSASPMAVGQLNVSLTQAEATVASLRTRVAEYTARSNQLKESAMLMPQLESEFAQLNRDYEINKKNYESLIGRRESATMSSEMQTATGVGDYKLIDPPRVDPRPVTPPRLILLGLALLFSLGAGSAAAYCATMLYPTFCDSRALRDATHLPLLGTVMLADSPVAIAESRRSLLRFAAGLGALLFTYLAGGTAMLLLMNRVA